MAGPTHLRLLHLNTGLLSRALSKLEAGDYLGAFLDKLVVEPAGILFGQAALTRVDTICDRIDDAPYDIICFNEVFDEPSRDRFVERLAPTFPHYVSKIGAGGNPLVDLDELFFGEDKAVTDVAQIFAPLLDDSGLMVFSRFPLGSISIDQDDPDLGELLFSSGTADYAFVKYTSAAYWDGLAPKGGAAVVVHPPASYSFVLGLTHLQADYASKQKHYPEVRHKQVGQWWDLIRRVARSTQLLHVVACGDLNVRGEPLVLQSGAMEFAKEYTDLFEHQGSPFPGSGVYDQWWTGSLSERFQTHESGQRLDYLLAGTLEPVPGGSLGRFLVSEHTMLARNLFAGDQLVPTPIGTLDRPARGGSGSISDHVGLNAILNVGSPHCQPYIAKPIHFQDEWQGPASAQLTPELVGALQWAVHDKPGTCFVAVDPPDTEVLVFAAKDLSAPLGAMNPVDRTPLQERLGTRYSMPEPPMYIRLRHPESTWMNVRVERAFGQSRELAHLLDGNRAYDLVFPDNVLNETDEMWSEAWIEGTTSGAPLRISVRLTAEPAHPHDAPFELSVEDTYGRLLATAEPGPSAVIRFGVEGPCRIFPKVRRLLADAPPFTLEWWSNASIFHGPVYGGVHVADAGPLELHAVDESGWDSGGSDEIRLTNVIDNAVELVQSWEHGDKFDTGERKPADGIAPARFLQGLQLSVREVGGSGGDQIASISLGHLLEGDATTPAEVDMTFTEGSGTYKLRYNRSRWLSPGESPP